ncbi:hypothetical protein [Pseudoxanthomonas putridarboris]|uniref:hypothetical protein n=1 Tax=Pseudoxanthomonas putridarboris TaxID=752605 RepID=UPI00311D5EF0
MHFWIGASAPSVPIEDRIADKVVAIRDTTVDRLLGRSAPERVPEPPVDMDRLVIAATSVLGGLAFVLAMFGFARREPRRACVGAAVLGAAAILFPFVIGAIGAVIVMLALAALLSVFFG